MSWAEFFAMGGYAGYVWGVYATAAVILIVNLLLPLRRHRAVRARLRAQHRHKR